VVLPPVAHRREDIPLLVDSLIRKFSVQQGKQIEGISEDALGVLMGYGFPGNVRQLQKVIEHDVVLCHGDRIEIECLPVEMAQKTPATNDGAPEVAGGPLPEAEAAAIAQTLREHAGHRGRTAKALGLNQAYFNRLFSGKA